MFKIKSLLATIWLTMFVGIAACGAAVSFGNGGGVWTLPIPNPFQTTLGTPGPSASPSASPSPSPSPTSTATAVAYSGAVTDQDGVAPNLNTCNAPQLVVGFGCDTIDISHATVTGTLVVGGTFTGFGVNTSGTNVIIMSSITFSAPAPTPSPSPTVTPSPVPSVVYVQQFHNETALSSVASTLTVTLGTSGSATVAPTTPDAMLAVVQVSSNGATTAAPSTIPTGFTLLTGGSANLGWNHQYMYYMPAGTTKPASLTFANFEGAGASVSASIRVFEARNVASAEVIASGGVTAGTGASSTTGTGTATVGAGLPIVAAIMEDGCFSAGTITGFTAVANCQNGNGSSSFGGTYITGFASADITGTSVASTTIPFSGASSANNNGMKVLLEPASGGASPSPSPSPSPSSTPNTLVVKSWYYLYDGEAGYTNPDPTTHLATTLAPIANLVYIFTDKAHPEDAPLAHTYGFQTTWYYDPGRICNTEDGNLCSIRPDPNSLNPLSTNVMQCGTSGPLLSDYHPAPSTYFGDPTSTTLTSDMNTMWASQDQDYPWLDDQMMLDEQWISGAGSPCTQNATSSNITYGSNHAMAYTQSNWATAKAAEYARYSHPVFVEGAGGGSGWGNANGGQGNLTNGDANDPSPMFNYACTSPNVRGFVFESDFEGENEGSNGLNGKAVNAPGAGAPVWQERWNMNANDHLWAYSCGKYTMPLSYSTFSSPDSIGENDKRGYLYTSMMIVYDPTYFIDMYPQLGAAGDPLAPEMGLVPGTPRATATWPTRIQNSTLNQSGAYVREFTNCHYFGQLISDCFFAVNPDRNATHTISTVGTYAHSVSFTNDSGVLNGQYGNADEGDVKNNISFSGSVTHTLAPGQWEIGIGTAPTP